MDRWVVVVAGVAGASASWSCNHWIIHVWVMLSAHCSRLPSLFGQDVLQSMCTASQESEVNGIRAFPLAGAFNCISALDDITGSDSWIAVQRNHPIPYHTIQSHPIRSHPIAALIGAYECQSASQCSAAVIPFSNFQHPTSRLGWPKMWLNSYINIRPPRPVASSAKLGVGFFGPGFRVACQVRWSCGEILCSAG